MGSATVITLLSRPFGPSEPLISLTQGVALGYPISPLRGCCKVSTFCFQIPVLHVLAPDSWLLTSGYLH